ncbi:MAG TPA: sodium-dependent bicarbonate transport family permease [Longimicrobium sp.]
METLELVRLNLLSPVILAFALGIVATLARSDLKFPEPLYTALSIYLLLAIGLKGGAALSETSPDELGGPALATLALGLAIPLWSYAIVRRVGRMSVPDAAAIAAHYGSVSVVTFIAALSFLDAARVGYEGFLPTLVAVLEVPAIVVALLLARLRGGAGRGSWRTVLHEVFAGRSVVLLLGGLAVGALSGTAGLARVSPFFVDPFQGALVLFLLEMGMVAARRFRDLRTAGGFLLGFGIVMPLLHGTLGVWLGSLAGLSLGGSTVLGVMAASASYIAAPAAVRIALPEANPGYYLTAALAITFPFNLTVGIPVYFAVARWMHAGGGG